MRIEDVRSMLEIEGDCFLDLPRQIGKTTELVKFATEKGGQGKNVLFVCGNNAHRDTIRDMIIRESISSGHEFSPVERRRVGDIFLETSSRRRGSTWNGTTFDIAIFDEFTHMSEDDINSYRLFCRRLVGLGTSRIMERNTEINENPVEESTIEDIGIVDVNVDEEIRRGFVVDDEVEITTNSERDAWSYASQEPYVEQLPQLSKTDRYLTRLGILKYVKHRGIQEGGDPAEEAREGNPRATISREVGENIWSIP